MGERAVGPAREALLRQLGIQASALTTHLQRQHLLCARTDARLQALAEVPPSCTFLACAMHVFVLFPHASAITYTQSRNVRLKHSVCGLPPPLIMLPVFTPTACTLGIYLLSYRAGWTSFLYAAMWHRLTGRMVSAARHKNP